jgi:NitT/TauT family transport system substrate-binding protein
MLLSAAAAAAAAGLVLVAAGCGSSSKSSAGSSAGSSQATQNVRLLSYASSSLGWIGYVAQKNGYFAANHLNVSLVVLPAGAQATNALVGGALDVAELDPNNMAPLLAQGQQFKLLLGEQRTFWEMLVSGNLANDTLSQVMQSVTSIGAPSVGGSGGRLAQYMALAYGRSASSLSVVADPVGTALLGGHISALMADPQTGCVLQTQGPKELFDFLTPPADQSGLPAQVRSLFGSAEFGYWASTSWTNGHPQAVKDLQAALTQAINWASSPANLAALTTLLRSTPRSTRPSSKPV